MSDWHDVEGDNPQRRTVASLLLLTQPEKFDAADDVYDVTIGYWHEQKKEFRSGFQSCHGAERANS